MGMPKPVFAASWMAGNALICKKGPLETPAWARVFLKRLLTGNPYIVAATIRRMATMSALTETELNPVDACCKDRMGINGGRMGLEAAEAIVKLRVVPDVTIK